MSHNINKYGGFNMQEKRLKEELKELFINLNAESQKSWEDEKYLELLECKEIDEEVHLSLSIGRWESQTFHDVVVDQEGWEVKQQSASSPILEDVMHYFIMPAIFGDNTSNVHAAG